MARSHWSTLCLSEDPEQAACLLEGIPSVIVVFNPTDDVIGYSGRLLIHSLGYPEDPAIQKQAEELMEAVGYSPENFPAYALQGWATVSRIKPYTPELFAKEAELHGHGEDLTLYAAQCGFMGAQAWGIYLKDTCTLDIPVLDVIPPEGINEGEMWLPENPLHIEAWKLALSAEVEEDEDEPPLDLTGLINN